MDNIWRSYHVLYMDVKKDAVKNWIERTDISVHKRKSFGGPRNQSSMRG